MKKVVAAGARYPARVVAGKRVVGKRVVGKRVAGCQAKPAPQPRKPLPGLGSAIFMHHARPGLSATDGCIAIDETSLRKLLARIGPRTRILIG